MSSPRKPALLLLVSILLAACGAPAPRPGAPQPAQRAHALISEGKFPEAADAYLELASKSSGAAATGYRLAAADALVRGGRTDAAKKILSTTPASGLAGSLLLQRKLVLARIHIAEKHPESALQRIPASAASGAPPALAREVYEVRALAFSQQGDLIDEARARVALDYLIENPDAARENRHEIWKALTGLTPEQLQHNAIPPPDTLGGWIRLADIARRYGTDPGALQAAVSQWESEFPGHPATDAIVPELIESSRIQAKPPDHIALLLPFEGRFEQAAEAIRDGFLAAWFHDAANAARPTVSVLDTSSAAVPGLYRKAVSEGADFVVGPLEKESVNALRGSGAVSVPTLALNYSDDAESVAGGSTDPESEAQPKPAVGSAKSNAANGPAAPGADLFQFSLSPEAEARRVAQRAWFDGKVRAAVLVPDGAWGQRVGEAFASEWKHLGGLVVGTQTYPSNVPDMSEPVRSLLHIDGSEQRMQARRRLLHRDIKFVVRRRQDLDMIFMAALPREARQIRPQLKFYQAEGVPVYSTSHVYSGAPDAAADRDIDGVTFGDMPWVLTPDTAAAGIRKQVQAAWPQSFPDYLRLYAFGVDAYRVIPHLRQLRAQPYTEFDGATGELSVDGANRVERHLVWARFEDGVPRVGAPAESKP